MIDGRMAGMNQTWRYALAWFNDRLKRALPGYCAFCHAAVRGGVPWCPDCHADMPWNRHACMRCAEPLPRLDVGDTPNLCGRCLRRESVLSETWAPLRYEERLVRLIQRFKFSADPRAGEILLQLMTASLSEAPTLGEAIVGVPGQRERTRERGFDHTAWLATRLADRLRLSLVPAVRLRETPSQRGLDRLGRRRNVKHAFAVTRPLPAAVVVVDDVMTTGATLESLATACRAVGAERVTALAFARTPSNRI